MEQPGASAMSVRGLVRRYGERTAGGGVTVAVGSFRWMRRDDDWRPRSSARLVRSPEGNQAGALAVRWPPPELGAASSAVSGVAMLSSDFCSACTPRKIATMPPAIINAAPT
jgi:hypothetical protein